VPQPSHRFDERRGDIYYYIAAVSEEDRKRGRAVGTVSSFQYLGKTDAGEHIVASLNDNGTVSYRAKCAPSCKIIDTDYGERIPYSPSSIIGAVFQDAFHGRLRTAQWTKDPVAQPTQAAPMATQSPVVAAIAPSSESLPEPSSMTPIPGDLDTPTTEAIDELEAPTG
jgi:hypothetical protein